MILINATFSKKEEKYILPVTRKLSPGRKKMVSKNRMGCPALV